MTCRYRCGDTCPNRHGGHPSIICRRSITVNGASGGRTFDGVGAVSGGGGNSRLLID
ncbi:hypothetical protein ACFVYA_30285 [Amycolatopsis sp. NPDC058278]|uniref:hypothetical protein n=1 Tax=Amycolatopsis sp. NPDC058278 TaxID=3346417 RepID=UPI0036DE32F7